jgi:hypothetical protein
MINLAELKRYHLFLDACCYPDQKFLGDFDSFEAADEVIKKRYEEKKKNCKSAYAIVAMGDMSPASLAESGGDEPSDVCVEFIGNFTKQEFAEQEKEFREIEAHYKEQYGDEVWLDTIYSEDDEVGFCDDEYSLWDSKLMCWFDFDDCRLPAEGNLEWREGEGSGFDAQDYKAA